MVENDIHICSNIHKKFNPALTMILLKLLNQTRFDKDLLLSLQTLIDKYSETLNSFPSSQILIT